VNRSPDRINATIAVFFMPWFSMLSGLPSDPLT
jgi:hypothetical protein